MQVCNLRTQEAEEGSQALFGGQVRQRSKSQAVTNLNHPSAVHLFNKE